MSSQLGPIEICCDCPPYSVVRASKRIGLEFPEDVRWWRLSDFRKQGEQSWGLFRPRTWRLPWGTTRPAHRDTCSCGAKLPLLQRYAFTFRTGNESSYLIGQCLRCRTVFWEEAD
jgi:hypothetical protein